jgi:hypothetical protein
MERIVLVSLAVGSALVSTGAFTQTDKSFTSCE